MRLEDITAEVRPRGRWEAVDLGFALTRRHLPRLLAAWIICVGPILAALLVASRWIGMGWAVVLIWWLKPLFDRVPLFILSRALFGAVPKLGEMARAWPRLLTANLWRSLVASRFSGTRTLLLPVIMLEGLRGADFKARSAVLTRHSGGCAGSLTFVCALYEGVLAIGIGALIAMFIPGDGAERWTESLAEVGITRGLPATLVWLAISCWLVAMMFVELFYTGAGFGLYLNVRTHLEGWDVELAFRRLGRRLAGVAAALVVLFGLGSTVARADEIAEEKAKSRGEIEEVLKNEDFKIHKTEEWVRESKTSGLGGGKFFVALAYVLFWVAVAVAIFLIVRFLIKYRFSMRSIGGREAPPPPALARTVAGLDVTPESLPDDIVGAARQRWLAGDAPGALSLLYRGALSRLVHSLGLPIVDSDTEGDCLRRAALLSDPRSREYFTGLTARWIGAVYAGHEPDSASMEALLTTWPYNSQPAVRKP